MNQFMNTLCVAEYKIKINLIKIATLPAFSMPSKDFFF